ncbi:MAG: alpha/beta hydrolase-fold protein [Gemmatimonadales bacterium]
MAQPTDRRIGPTPGLTSWAMLSLAGWLLGSPCAVAQGPRPFRVPAGKFRFEVRLAPGMETAAARGRLFVIVGRSRIPEPRRTVGTTGFDTAPFFAADVDLSSRQPGVIDQRAAAFPLPSLAQLPSGHYFVQAALRVNPDLRGLYAPANLYSDIVELQLDPGRGGAVKLTLNQADPPEELPAPTPYLRWIRIRSELLSKFRGRPVYLRAGVLLPRNYDPEGSKRYPLRIDIGDYGTRYTYLRLKFEKNPDFHSAWLADGAPRMILLYLDGDGPFGDPYQVNSANNGPYGDAITRELIPYVERTYRAVGQPWARVLTGGSTGGWVSLALQVFYPDYFNGAWAGYPDGVDFRAVQLLNIYQDSNAYVNAHGFERPAARDLDGDVTWTMRHELQMENAMGSGDSYTTSGGQWGAWNAVYSPRGEAGRPMPLWDPKTGSLDRSVAEQWKRYDLRLLLQQNWATLGPKLRGKLHIHVGEADQYFLNNGIHLLDDFLSKAQPPYGGSIVYGVGKGHGWSPLTARQRMEEMQVAMDRARP